MKITRLIAALTAAALSFTLLVAGPPAQAGTTEANALVHKINQLRASQGLAPLTVDAELTRIGQSWAEHMASTGTLAHNPDFANQVTQPWVKLGENVGMNSSGVDAIHEAFVNSSVHYKNLVDPAFTHVGIGAVWAGGALWVSQQFMRLEPASTDPAPADSEPAPASAPAPAPAPAPTAAPAAAPAPASTATPATPAVEAEPAGETPGGERIVRVLEPLRALDA